MKNIKSLHLPILLLFLSSTSSYAQGALAVHIGAALPAGDFAADNPRDSHAGLAEAGLAAGVEVRYQIPESALGLFAGVSLAATSVSSDAADAWKADNRSANISLPKAVTLPLTAGVSYILKADKKYALLGKAGLAGSFLSYSDFSLKESGYDPYSESYDASFALGYAAGVEISGRHLLLDVHYMGLGKHTIAGTWKEGDNSGELQDAKKEVGLVLLTLGWKFN